MEENRNTVQIRMLGDFSISCGDKTINEKNRRSKKMWTLLKYLIIFRSREISQKELIDLLWPAGESDNPNGALKTQLHRLRTMLQELGIAGELIISVSGTYAFNNSLDCIIDAEEFEALFKKATRMDISEKETVTYLKRAFELYKGDFLHKSSSEKWVIPTKVYYHSIFLNAAHRLSDILFKYKQYSDLINVCKKTVMIDNLDHKAHYGIIKALYETGECCAAKRHYFYATDVFYNRQGVNPPQELISLYEEIIKSEKCFEPDLNEIKQHLGEKDEYADCKQSGAFFCEFEFFKHVYNLEMRETERTGKQFCLCLLTVKGCDCGENDSKQLGKVMQNLFESISKSLRASDIFARYSASQFIILFPSEDAETTELVISRIIKKYRTDNRKCNMNIDYQYCNAKL